jgi:hypothetical protein
MSWLILILVPIIVYWFKVHSKFLEKETGEGQKKFFLQVAIVLILLVGVWWYFWPETTLLKPNFYEHPQGLLLFVVTILTGTVWPIIMEMRIDKRHKKESA